MAQVSGTTDSYNGVGIREDLQDVIYDLSPTDTPAMSMAKRLKASNTYHEWQTDSLAAAGTNAQIEGDDATFATATPTTRLGNRTQILRKTILISDTYEKVNKAGRDSELAYQLRKQSKELKQDIEFMMTQNQASSAGSSAAARLSAGLESMIYNNVQHGTGGTTPGFSGGNWSAPTDGTVAGRTFTEAMLKDALEQAWTDGGDASVIMMSSTQKKQFDSFAGASQLTGYYTAQQGKQQGMIVGAADVYISSYGQHRVVLNRFMRTSTVLCLDPEYIGLAWLRPITQQSLAKTGDAEKRMLIGECCTVVQNPDAHAKIADLAT